MKNKKVWALIVIAALGYFVDIYDLILFNVVKRTSLESMGYSGAELDNNGIYLFNWQMTGMLIGGLLWGILGDKKGRITVLFGSILLYSIANIANAFVTDIEMYKFWRLLAGIGLAGELGAGITLVVESMETSKRGYGTMIIVTVGALGAVAASLVGKNFSWQTAYIVGGCLGFALLVLRAGAFESGLYKSMKTAAVSKGNFFSLFNERKRFQKYIACIFIGLPIWFVVGVLISLSDKFADFIGVAGKIKVGDSVMYSYIGLSAGDLLSGLLSQYFKSRRKVVMGYIFSLAICFTIYLFNHEISVTLFYFMCFLLGASTGYWALFVTIASEQFGTNLRSTVTNTVPNFVRGAVVPITLSFKALKDGYGIETAALIVGSTCIVLALASVIYVRETFSKDLNYFEVD